MRVFDRTSAAVRDTRLIDASDGRIWVDISGAGDRGYKERSRLRLLSFLFSASCFQFIANDGSHERIEPRISFTGCGEDLWQIFEIQCKDTTKKWNI